MTYEMDEDDLMDQQMRDREWADEQRQALEMIRIEEGN